MFNKWKAKRELVKAFEIYRKEYTNAYKYYNYVFYIGLNNENYDIIDEAYNYMKSLDDILKALAYVLYSNFHMFGIEDKCWIETYYDLYKDEGKLYFEKITKQHNTTKYNYATYVTNIDNFKGNYSKGDIMYNIENGCFYIYDGKKFLNMC
jgi:hypothetical protein